MKPKPEERAAWEAVLEASGLAELPVAAPPGEAVDAAGEKVVVRCPHCGEAVEILVDAESRGRFVQDCEVCCNPWQITVDEVGEGGRRALTVEPL